MSLTYTEKIESFLIQCIEEGVSVTISGEAVDKSRFPFIYRFCVTLSKEGREDESGTANDLLNALLIADGQEPEEIEDEDDA